MPLHWSDELPATLRGVVVGNEVLDAMPVQLLARVQGVWHERGVVVSEGKLAWADRPTHLRPPVEIPDDHDYLTEIHPQGEAFVRTLADRLQAGAIFLLDYGLGFFTNSRPIFRFRHSTICRFQSVVVNSSFVKFTGYFFVCKNYKRLNDTHRNYIRHT